MPRRAFLLPHLTGVAISEMTGFFPEDSGLRIVAGCAVAFLVHVGEVVAGLADAAFAGLFAGRARQGGFGEDVVAGEVVGAEVGEIEAGVVAVARLRKREDGAGVL